MAADSPQIHKLTMWLLGALLTSNVLFGGLIVTLINNSVEDFKTEIRADLRDLQDEVRLLNITLPRVEDLEQEIDRLRDDFRVHESRSAHRGHPHPTDATEFQEFLNRNQARTP